MAMNMSRGMTPDELFDSIISDNFVPMSFMDRLRFSMLTNKGPWIADHFEAMTLADLPVPWTGTALGAGTVSLVEDDNPSVVHLASNGALNDGYRIDSDILTSCLGLGGQTLCLEARLRLLTEATTHFQITLINATGGNDIVSVLLDSTAGAPGPNGCISSYVNGAQFMTDANLVATEDLTLYHVYRLEFDPAVEIRLFVDGTLRATENDPGEVCPDQAFAIRAYLQARAAANRTMDLDYIKVWGE